MVGEVSYKPAAAQKHGPTCPQASGLVAQRRPSAINSKQFRIGGCLVWTSGGPSGGPGSGTRIPLTLSCMLASRRSVLASATRWPQPLLDCLQNKPLINNQLQLSRQWSPRWTQGSVLWCHEWGTSVGFTFPAGSEEWRASKHSLLAPWRISGAPPGGRKQGFVTRSCPVRGAVPG